MLRAWSAKCADASETANWLTAHTKPCPKCAKAVEKNGGCNLVACTCGACFCWLCGQGTGREHTWTSISGHTCGRYREQAEAAAERAASDLKRYLHFHGRWKAHADSGAAEERHRADVAEKVAAAEAAPAEQQQQQQAQLRDYSWLTAGQAQLFMCAFASRASAATHPLAHPLALTLHLSARHAARGGA
jgi:ariadne-1